MIISLLQLLPAASSPLHRRRSSAAARHRWYCIRLLHARMVCIAAAQVPEAVAAALWLRRRLVDWRLRRYGGGGAPPADAATSASRAAVVAAQC